MMKRSRSQTVILALAAVACISLDSRDALANRYAFELNTTCTGKYAVVKRGRAIRSINQHLFDGPLSEHVSGIATEKDAHTLAVDAKRIIAKRLEFTDDGSSDDVIVVPETRDWSYRNDINWVSINGVRFHKIRWGSQNTVTFLYRSSDSCSTTGTLVALP